MLHSYWILQHTAYGLALGSIVHVTTWLVTRAIHWLEQAVSKGSL